VAVQTLVPRQAECALVANVRSAEWFAVEEQAQADRSGGPGVDGSFLADSIPDGSVPADCSTALWADDWAQLGSVPVCLAPVESGVLQTDGSVPACLAPAELGVLQPDGSVPACLAPAELAVPQPDGSADYSARADPNEQRCSRDARSARSALAELPRDSPERCRAPQFVSQVRRRGR